MNNTKASTGRQSFLIDKNDPFVEGKSERERTLISILGIIAVGVQIALVIMLMRFLGSFQI